MPAKTGGSHALSAFVNTVVGIMLSKYVWQYTPPLAEASTTLSARITQVTGTAMPEELGGALVVVVALSFVWGIVYHFIRH
jgi:hypothetical protein